MATHTISVTAALLLVNLLHVVVGEQAPTYLGIERTRAIARYLAPGLYWWTRLLRPIIRAADWIAKSLLALFGVTITRSWTEGGRRRKGTSHELRGCLSRDWNGAEPGKPLPQAAERDPTSR